LQHNIMARTRVLAFERVEMQNSMKILERAALGYAAAAVRVWMEQSQGDTSVSQASDPSCLQVQVYD